MDRVMSDLTTEQREKLKELMGDQFDLSRGQGQDGRRFGRQRGGGGRGR